MQPRKLVYFTRRVLFTGLLGPLGAKYFANTFGHCLEFCRVVCFDYLNLISPQLQHTSSVAGKCPHFGAVHSHTAPLELQATCFILSPTTHIWSRRLGENNGSTSANAKTLARRSCLPLPFHLAPEYLTTTLTESPTISRTRTVVASGLQW